MDDVQLPGNCQQPDACLKPGGEGASYLIYIIPAISQSIKHFLGHISCQTLLPQNALKVGPPRQMRHNDRFVAQFIAKFGLNDSCAAITEGLSSGNASQPVASCGNSSMTGECFASQAAG